MSEPRFVTSSFCFGGDCVAVAPSGGGVVVRSTVSGAEVAFSESEWTAFLAGVRNGEFDLAALNA
ncbi:DUF397 domain-containing protein [Pseudonocardia sp. C8]|uniref:DUF397 domain-containing protein n=1 Tax=Pseudonocardia sp. C8 TaxID=2762759 RepID=UPI00351C953C